MTKSLPVVFAAQSDEFARIDLVFGQVEVIVTIMALHNYAEHWQARLRIDMPAREVQSAGWAIPAYQTQTNEATDIDRDVLAEWLAKRLMDAMSLFTEV